MALACLAPAQPAQGVVDAEGLAFSPADAPRAQIENTPPAFPEGAEAERSVAENTASGTAFGDAVAATDPDASDTLIYSLSGTDKASFAVEEGTGQLKTKSALDYEKKSSYKVTVRVDDGFEVVSIAVTINVTNVNEAPEFPEGAPFLAVDENTASGTAFGDAVAATDPDDGDALTYSLTGANASLFAIDEDTGRFKTKSALNYEGKNTYQVTVTVSDGSLTDTVLADVSVNDVDEPPGKPSAPSVSSNGETSLSVSWPAPTNTGPAITDYDVQYRLKGSGGFTSHDHTGATMSAALTDLASGATYEVQVRASNAEGEGAWSDSGEGTTDAANRAPVFGEGTSASRSVAENSAADTAIGEAVAATDPNPADTLTYSLAGTDASSFTIDGSTGQLKTKSALNYEKKSSYAVTVTVSDGALSDTIAVTIAVTNVNEAPEFPDGAPVLAVDENTASGTAFDSPVTATDPDGDTLTYSLSGTDASSFIINEDTGQLSAKAALDYEKKSSHAVTVTVSDGSLSDKVTVDISVNDVNEPPGKPDTPSVSSSAESSLSVSWSAPTNTGPAVTDYDVQYRLKGANDFTSHDHTGTATSATIMGLASGATYEVQVRASNAEGTGTWSDSGEGTTGAANTPPTFTEGATAARSVAENTISDTAFGDAVAATDPNPADTLTYSLAGTDASSFAIGEGTGQLKTKAALDFEKKSSYAVTVRADDGFEVASIAVTISVTNVNEAPEFPEGAPALDVDENTAAGTAFGDAVAATDPDDGDTLTYSLSGANSSLFDINGSTGRLKVKAALNHEGTNTYQVTVTVSDGSLTDSVVADISVNDVDEPPGKPSAPSASSSGESSLSVSWSAPANTGPAITDYDVQYRVKGGSGFTSHDHTGTATSATITNLASGATYEVQVRASNAEGTGAWSDSGEGTTAAANRAPSFTEGATATRNVDENTASGTAFGDAVAATDPDASDTLTYSLSGTDASSFAVDEDTGQLKTKSALDYEDANTYQVTVTVSDGSLTDSVLVDISVNDADEPPGKPSAPSASSSGESSLSVSWSAPANTGPAITDYDVQYRVKGGSGFTSHDHTGTSTSATLVGLASGATYEVQVRASNDEGIGAWSDSGEGTTAAANRAPSFTEGATATRSVAENTAAGAAFGDAVAATDPDSDTLTYSLTGADASSFAIDGSTGRLSTKSVLDYERTSTYQVTVTVSDGSLTDTVQVNISVIDVDEPPGKPSAPTASPDGSTSLNVSWSAPANTGPRLSDYDVRYRVKGADDFTAHDHTGTATSATIAGLAPETTYEVQVRASNDEGTGAWSDSGEGTTGAANTPPTFTEGATATRGVAENTAAGTAFGDAVSATDPNPADTLTYSLAGTDASSFAIEESTGQLKTRSALDFEKKSSYAVTVRADDGFEVASIAVTIAVADVNEAPEFADKALALDVNENTPAGVAVGDPVTATDPDGDALTYSLSGSDASAFNVNPATGQITTSAPLDYEGSRNTYKVTVTASDGSLTDSVAVDISVNNLTEPPDVPDAPAVAPAAVDGHSSLDVAWTAPAGNGSPITDYDIEYREVGATALLQFVYPSAETQTTIAGLEPTTDYEVRVRAANAESPSDWSAFGEGQTLKRPNSPPAFVEDGPATRAVDENTPPGRNIGAPLAARDPDGPDVPLTYALSGADASSFDIAPSTGQLQVRAGLNHEARASYAVTVSVSDDDGGTATIEVTISVADVDEPPGTPGAPKVTLGEEGNGVMSLEVSWAPPTNSGPPITRYEVQYRQAQDDFTDAGHVGTATSATITALTPGATYEVQVRAVNDEGEGLWSDSGRYRPSRLREPQRVVAPLESTFGAPPAFIEGAETSREVDENTPPGVAIGRPIAARPQSGVAYALESSDAHFFSMDPRDGQLRTKRPLNYEAVDYYTLRVSAANSDGEARIRVTVFVNDVDEPPEAPYEPFVVPAPTDGRRALRIVWDPPDNTGPPITGYDLQYRESEGGGFSYWPHRGLATTATITGLLPGVVYEVRVRAANAEGVGPWSPSGWGATLNLPPVFVEAAAAVRTVDEHTPAGQKIGVPVAAADPDGDALFYALLGVDANAFAIDEATGQLLTREELDYEAEPSYSVIVEASDGKGGRAVIIVRINVGDANDAPVAEDDVVATDEDVAVVVRALDNDQDQDTGALLQVESVTQPANGSASIGHDGAITYTPNPNYHGPDAFTYVVSDGTASDVGDVSVVVRPVNDPPVAVGSIPMHTAEVGGADIALDLAPYFTDPDGDALVYNAAPVASAAMTVTDGVLTVTPTDAGESSVAVTATDPEGASAQAEFALVAVRAAPANGDGQSVRLVLPNAGESRVDGAGGHAVVFPANARASPFQVRISSEGQGCDGGAGGGERLLCVEIELFDLWAGELDGALDRPAALTLRLDASQASLAASAHDVGLLRVMRRARAPDPWDAIPDCSGSADTPECFTLTQDADGGGRLQIANLSGFSQFSLVVRPPPPPEFVEGATALREAPENSPGGFLIGAPVTARAAGGRAVVYRIASGDASLFDVVPQTGQIVLRSGAEFDYESPRNPYVLTVVAADGETAATIEVVITALNVQEPGAIVLDSEGAPMVGALMTAALTDPDGGVSNVKWRWERSSGVGWAAIEGAESPGYAPTDEDVQMLLRATATYDDAAGTGMSLSSAPVGPVRSAPAPQAASLATPTPTPAPVPTSTPLPSPTQAASEKAALVAPTATPTPQAPPATAAPAAPALLAPTPTATAPNAHALVSRTAARWGVIAIAVVVAAAAPLLIARGDRRRR